MEPTASAATSSTELTTIYRAARSEKKTGSLQVGDLVKHVTTGNTANEKINFLAAQFATIQPKDIKNPKDRTAILETAQALWASSLFKTLSPEQRKGINAVRENFSGFLNLGVKIQNFFLSFRDMHAHTEGLSPDHKKALDNVMNNAETEYRGLSSRSTNEIKTFLSTLQGKLTQASRSFGKDHGIRDLQTHSDALFRDLFAAIDMHPKTQGERGPEQPSPKKPEAQPQAPDVIYDPSNFQSAPIDKEKGSEQPSPQNVASRAPSPTPPSIEDFSESESVEDEAPAVGSSGSADEAPSDAEISVAFRALADQPSITGLAANVQNGDSTNIQNLDLLNKLALLRRLIETTDRGLDQTKEKVDTFIKANGKEILTEIRTQKPILKAGGKSVQVDDTLLTSLLKKISKLNSYKRALGLS